MRGFLSRGSIALLLFVIQATLAFAQSTNIAIGSTTLQPSIKRMGINLGTLTSYDSGQMMKNLIVENPGFEGQIWNSTIRCAYGTATSCADENSFSGWPAGFWNGATYQVFYGTAMGRSGTVTSSTASGNGTGVILNFGDSGVAPAQGDYLIVRKTAPGGSTGGWFPNAYGAGSVGDNLTDLPPGTLGKQTTVLTAPAANDVAVISTYFDSTAGISFIQLNGTYNLQFKAKALGGSNQVGVKFERAGGSSFINQAVNLTNSWNTYNLTFSAAENGAALGTIGLSFSTVFGADSFELDDVSVTQTNGDPTNPTAFRDSVVSTLRTLQPGIIRYWGGNGQLGETLDNLLTPQFGRQRAGFSEYFPQSNQIDYGLHEFLVLCQTLGAEPWFVVPSTFSSTDAANLIEYLAGSATTTTYGAKRAALGQTTPWTQVFSKLHLEFGNEEWNSTFSGGSILYPGAYGTQGQTIFAAMQADAAYTPGGNLDFVMGGQASTPYNNAYIQTLCTNDTSMTIAPYTMGTVDSYSDNESLFGSTFAEPEALMSGANTSSAEGLSPGLVYQTYQAIQASSHPVPLSFYEINMSTLGGAITQSALNGYESSLGAGLMVADTMFQGLQQFGVVNQNLFALPQYNFTRPDGSTVYLWGAVIDMGVTNRKRPQYLALQLANQALSTGGSMLQTVQSGLNPTWNESLTNTVQITGAHYLQSYAFQQGTNFSAVIFNLSRTSTLPVTFSGSNAPAGTVLMQQLTSANLTDTNETSNVVAPTSSTLTAFNAASGLSLPPYSMTVLTWSTSSGTPVISSVSASGITKTSATVTWTTDELSSSQVNYGTTNAYGSSSPSNSTLTTTHSVALSGLTAGTAYNFDVASANSAGTSATSANFTFSTPLPAPVISSINVSAITPTSATITWITDQASTSQLFYGTSAAYGQAVLNSTLSTSHSVALTGLTASTSYSIQVASANSAGTLASSSNLTFSTLSGPVISAVTASNISTTSTTITWTTDQASTTQVLYGTSSSYGASAQSATLVTNHSITLTGLTSNATYNFEVISANSYGIQSTSANFTFSTILQGGVISYVTSGGITNTSASITWTTDQASTSQVQYGTALPYSSASAVITTLATTHSVMLTGLSLGTTYNYAVVSTNSTGVATTSANFTFSTTGGSATTNIAIGTTTLQPSVKRLGINLGTLNNSDSGQLVKNLITANPGFQGQIWNSTIRCAAGTATTCTDENQYSGWPAGFWTGATYKFFYGTAVGRSGTVQSSSAPGSGTGISLNFADSGTVPAAGDYVIVRKVVSGGSSGGWFASSGGAGSVGDNTADLPPGTLDKQTTALVAPSSSDYATLSTAFDNTSGISFNQLNGTYQLQFKAKGLGGSNQIGVQLQRSGVSAYINQLVALTTSWNTYNLTFTATETGSSIGPVTLQFATVYGADSIELADVSLTQSNSDPTNPTVFRDPVVTALRTLQPGILRYWGGNGQLGETLDNLLAPQFARQRAGYSAYSSQATQIDYGLHEFLVLCQTLGAEPWFVVPSTFSTADAANLIEYLAGSATTTTYGAKRAALGQTAPWTQVFPTIHLEFGQEPWNSALVGGSILYPIAYAQRAQTIFAAMQANASYVAGSFDLVLGGQAANPANNTLVQNNCNNNTSFDIAPYAMSTVNSYSTNELLFGSTFAEPEALMSSSSTNSSAEGFAPGMVYQDYQAIQTSNHPVPMSFYGMNLSTLGGSITQSALNSYVSSLGAGLTVADTMLQGLKQFGIVNQSLYALPQYQSNRSDGSTVNLFGSVIDMGNNNRKRPQYLALQLANQALGTGAAMLQTTHTGYNPTWDEPLTNSVFQDGAHDLQSYAFSNGTNLSTVIFNFSRSATLPVTFSGANGPSGTVQMQQLTSANPTDTNESASVVNITPSTLTAFNGATGLSLPPYSMTVLTWSTASGAPNISTVASSAVTATSATITWTTDQSSSSQANYGITTSYGSSASGGSTLVTTHSVALTGLTAGTTYNYDVTSANAGGTQATSSNYTFSTPLAAPVISSVTVSSVSGTSAIIAWTTDQATTSQVSYGTTTAYGSVAQSSTLVTSHSVSLSGLTAGTTYNFDVASANSAGTLSTSANSAFTTTSVSSPVISAVTVTGITSTSATITWTTNVASSSLANYGTTSAYGSSSTLNSSLVTSHSVTLAGLTGNTTYNFDVVSANSAGAAATSPNSTFTMAAGTPVISAVTVTGITSNSVTVSWTTDQSTSSQINYGATASYGSSSALNSTLVTSHSVTLTGLAASTTYNFDVVSANSAGTSATSPNSTFATSAGTPVISGITVTANSSTSATITWTTDQTTSSLVNYGTTASYGSSSALNSSLVTTHSVTLSGLSAGTTYNFDIVSANSAGTSATSANSPFTTVAGTPVISGVAVTANSSTSATITWTTDQSTSSLVNYGTTASYGSSSALNSSLVTTHSITLSGLTAGTTYNFDVVSANSAGTSATSPNSTFATVAGTPVISGVTVTANSSTSATITWVTDQSTSSLVNYGTTAPYGSSSALNSSLVTSHSVTLTGLTAGTTYNFDVVSANSAGTSATSANSTFATTAGTPVISAVSVTGITSTSANITWTTDQATSSLVNYGTTASYGSSSALNSSLVTSHSVTLSGLTTGTTYNFDVVSANSAGTSANSSNSTFVTVAGTPVISAVSVTGITSTSANITWTTDQATSSLVNYGTTASYGSSSALNSSLVTSHSVTLSGLTTGTTYNFDVVSANSAGTSGTSSNSTFVTVAGTPVISAVAVTGITSTSATFTWTTDQSTSSLVNYGTTASYGSSSALNSSLVASHSVTLTGLSVGTTYNFDVKSANSAGTAATSANSTFTTTASTATPPYVGYVAYWGINNSGITISWSTDLAATTQLAYGTTNALGQLTALQTSLTASHGVVLTGLNSGTTYYFVAQSTAANGATGYSTTYSFTTTGTASTPTPVISSVTATSITSTSAIITWSTDQATTDQVNYGTTSSYGSSSALSTAYVTSHSVTLSGLTAGITYNYDVLSASSSGTQAVSSNYTFTTTAAAAPVISAVTSTVISSTSATITWTTSQAATDQVNYGTSTAYGSSSALSSALVTSHSVTLSGLAAKTTYNYNVVSANSAGTASTSANFTFATNTAPAPVISNVASTNISTTSATITWTTDQATSSLVNYGTTTAYGSSSTVNSTLVTSHSVNLTGLSAGTTYDFSVVSANSAGTSATSTNSMFVTTALAGPPTISAVTATNITGSSATITWTTNQSATDQVNYGTTTSYGASSAFSSTLVTSHSVTLNGLTAGTTYNFDVISANSANTSSTSANFTFATVSATATPPNVSYVADWGITSTGISISWSTDVAATTQLAYGTTSALGTLTPLQTATSTSHGVVLINLTGGTTYYFVAQSTGANGATGYSTTYSFTTTGTSMPAISAITVTTSSNNTAVISWTTAVPTYSYVQYGPTTAYNRYSSQTALTANPVAPLSYVPSGLTHYQLISTDANGNQTVSPDYTFTEP